MTQKQKRLIRAFLTPIVFFFVAILGGIIALYINPSAYSFLGEPAVEHNPRTTHNTNIQPPPYTPQTTTEERIIGIGENQLQSIVAITATKDLPTYEQCVNDFFDFRFNFPSFEQCPTGNTEKQQTGAGSGFIVADNIVLTNRHVVDDDEAQYTVITQDNRTLDATVITLDPVEDLALLKVDDLDIPSVQLGDSSNIAVGQIVIAVGNALGRFENSFSLGIVSGLRRTVVAGGFLQQSSTLREVIQTDAAINPGNSGGPLFNLSGDVIGVNVAYASSAQSIGFAIPINRIKSSLEQAIQTGKVEYPFLGISYITITKQVSENFDLPVEQGAYISSGENSNVPAILKGSSADKAGLQQGDIIAKINDTPITPSNEIALVLRDYEIGSSVDLQVIRNNQQLTIPITIQSRPDDI